MPKVKTQSLTTHSRSIDEDIVMMTARNDIIAKSVIDDIINPTETTTEEDTVIDQAKDIGIDLANAIIEDAPGQGVPTRDTIDAIEIAHVHLTDHGETITNDGEMSTKVPNSRFKQPQRYPVALKLKFILNLV